MAKLTASKGRYINPLTDYGFKRIFENEKLLINFLNSALGLKNKIVTLQYQNVEQKGRTKTGRSSFFDLHCTTGKGEYIIIEMQNMSQPFFKDRVLYYSTFPIQKQAKKGKWDFKLNPVYSVNILDFTISEDSDSYHHSVQLMDVKSKRVFYDKLTLLFIELADFNKSEEELKTVYDRWLYILKNLPRLQDMPAVMKKDRIFMELFEEAEIANMTPEELDLYDQSLKDYCNMNTPKDIVALWEKEVATLSKDVAVLSKTIAAKDIRIAELERRLGLTGTSAKLTRQRRAPAKA